MTNTNNNDDVKLYYDSSDKQNHITVKDYNKLLLDKNRLELANFVYNRLYSRYIKPFKFDNCNYQKEYKNGFSMMASFCLLIETLQSFKEGFGDSKNISSFLIRIFFYETNFFTEFKNQGKEIYTDIRCGILHQGETKGGWKITRDKNIRSSLENKVINANEFMEDLEKSLEEYKNNLINADWDSDLWKNFCKKMKQIIKNTK